MLTVLGLNVRVTGKRNHTDEYGAGNGRNTRRIEVIQLISGIVSKRLLCWLMLQLHHGFCGPQITLEMLAEPRVTIASGKLLSDAFPQNSEGHMGTGKIPGQI
jgi:hypothetical protein